MANYSFDVCSKCELQEVDNAVNQTRKELTQRYDFRNVTFGIDFKRAENVIILTAPDKMKANAIWDVLGTKVVKRKIPLKNLKLGDVQDAAGGTVRQVITLQQGIPGDTAKKIVKFLKEQKLKKVQSQIQQDQVRVSSNSKDSLQQVMALLRAEDWDLEVQFENYR